MRRDFLKQSEYIIKHIGLRIATTLGRGHELQLIYSGPTHMPHKYADTVQVDSNQSRYAQRFIPI